jgi:hypothetical protein
VLGEALNGRWTRIRVVRMVEGLYGGRALIVIALQVGGGEKVVQRGGALIQYWVPLNISDKVCVVSRSRTTTA